MPLLYWQLNATSPEAVPIAVLNQLRDHFSRNNLRNMYLTGELLRLLNVFKAHGILAVPFKGPVLAAFAFGNLGLREFVDLDVLVHKQDVSRATGLLVSLGYQPQYQLTRAQEEAFLRYERERTFVHGANGSVVELHWEVPPRAFSFALSTESLWGRLEQIPIGGNTVLTFSPEDLLLILCVHGATHLWQRLGWICDVAELLKVSNKGIDWGRLLQQSTAQGSQRMLFLGLFLASHLLGTELPEEVSERIQADTRVKTFARQVRERLFWEAQDPQPIFDEESLFQPFHLGLMERLRDRARYCAYQATSPVFGDWARMPLPAYLLPIYRVVRPIRLIGKYTRRALERLR